MRKLFSILILFSFAVITHAQDIHFSQLSETPLLLNPASTGVYDGYYRAILNYKSQWVVMGNPYRTFMGSFDMPVALVKNKKFAHLGAGCFFYSDKAGSSNFGTTQANLSVAGIVPINTQSNLSAGLQCGMAQRSADITSIQWPNQYNGHNYDPGISSNETNHLSSFSFFDMSTGVQYQYLNYKGTVSGKDATRFTAGVAVFHVTSPVQKFYSGITERQFPRIVVHTSACYDFPGSLFGIVPSVLYMAQGPASEVDLGLLIRYKINQGTKVTGFVSESYFSGGLQLRVNDAICPQVFFELSDYSIGLSYDINTSGFSQVSKNQGGLEVSVKYCRMRGAIYKNMK